MEYSMYEKGSHVGDGVTWSANRQTAHKLVDGEKKGEISLPMAEKLAIDKFGLPVPDPSTPVPSDASTSPSTVGRLLGKLFSSRRVGSDGTLLFKDNGEWGSYNGEVDASGNRQGKGKMTYDTGNYYEGGFVDDKFHGDQGVYHWSDGDEYEGSWKDGERNGKGSFKKADGTVEYSMYEKGTSVGDGVTWSADRQTAHKVLNGEKKGEISLPMAEKLAKDMFDLPVPEPYTPAPSGAPTSSKSPGFLGRLFSNRKVGPDGKTLYKDYGEWGSYDGDLDANGDRQGKGKMTYGSGSYYQGGFVDDKFHGDSGVYHWSDGDEYEGSWEDGERNGKGSFKKADGTVEYSMYEKGSNVGDGVTWSADRQTAHKVLNGEKKGEISLPMAEKL
ncbi:hypothetical protein ACHAXR_001046, partial [Thalassiosira sp. AJA248-18]